jgi:hypothetical protein
MANLPKKLFEDNISLKERAETSIPLIEVRFANSSTGRFSEIIDFERLIDTPICLHNRRYLSATSLSNNTRSSPSIT